MSHDIISSMKTCFKCGEAKPRSEFYKHSAMTDGLLGKCKDCTKADAKEHRLKNLEKIRKYDRTRATLPHRLKMALELQAIRRKADKRKGSCYSKVLRAVKLGVLERMPCVICGDKKSVAHHESYEKPLDVVWYCCVHHAARHKQMAIDGICP